MTDQPDNPTNPTHSTGSLDPDALSDLATRLTTSDQAPLTTSEKSLLSAALVQLAASQSALAKQSRLLQLHGERRTRINVIAADALNDLQSHLDAPAAVDQYDFDAADAARATLLAEIESANTTRATLAASLGFVRRLVGLGRP